jgi:predicted 2-oxoglutarate/Fe(II)-dependent dioxygenase YbiX
MQSIKYHNFQPSYIIAEDVISQDVADTLIELVNERGKKSAWSYNPDCSELQIANPFSPITRKNDEKIISILPDLFALGESCMRKMNQMFINNACEIITGHHGFWILKYDEGGQFEEHCDWDSGPNGIRPPVVATVCVLLNEDFSGGETVLSAPQELSVIVPRNKLSIIMWDGFTQHRIAPITEGKRYALVIHYTGTIK